MRIKTFVYPDRMLWLPPSLEGYKDTIIAPKLYNFTQWKFVDMEEPALVGQELIRKLRHRFYSYDPETL